MRFSDARGAVPLKEGQVSPEAAIRRVRGGISLPGATMPRQLLGDLQISDANDVPRSLREMADYIDYLQTQLASRKQRLKAMEEDTGDPSLERVAVAASLRAKVHELEDKLAIREVVRMALMPEIDVRNSLVRGRG